MLEPIRQMEKKRSTCEKHISLSVLQQHFSGSLKDAAKSIGGELIFSLSELVSYCRLRPEFEVPCYFTFESDVFPIRHYTTYSKWLYHLVLFQTHRLLNDIQMSNKKCQI